MLAVTPRTYAQLDADALDLLRRAVAEHKSRRIVAEMLGYSRPAISMALSGTYKADTAGLRARIMAVLVDQVLCPHLGRAIAPDECADLAARPMSTSNRDALKQWQACRACPRGQKGGCDAL